MLIFYTMVYLALGLYLSQLELNMLEEMAKDTDDSLARLGYFVDWAIVLILFPFVIAIRKSYEFNLTSSVIFFSGIFNFLKEFLSFLPKLILLFLIYVRKLLE